MTSYMLDGECPVPADDPRAAASLPEPAVIAAEDTNT
jgi:hypothetical protein